MAGLTAPSLETARNYSVNRPDAAEIIYQPVYDSLSYAAAGASQLTFFQSPYGSGGRTKQDTNMQQGGALPSPIAMLVTDIQIAVYPGILPEKANLDPASVQFNFFNDVWNLGKLGYLEFTVGSKTYLTDAPLCKFPADHGFNGNVALADNTTADAAEQSAIDYARFAGAVYNIVPILLIPTQNFDVTLYWPGVPPTLPSGQPARIVCTLGGFRYRMAQ